MIFSLRSVHGGMHASDSIPLHVQKWSDTEIELRSLNPCTTVNGAASLTIAMVGEIRETGHSTSTRTDITDVPMNPQW